MKTLLNLCLTAVIVLAFASQSQAQNTVKQLDKKTKSELKEYMKNPSSYRKMIKNYKDQLEGYELQITELQEDFYKADYLRILYYDSIQELREQIAEANTTTIIDNTTGEPITESSMFSNDGTDYRVQIGAYRYFDSTELLKFNQPISFDRVNGVIHYYLGSWGSADDAYDFALAIRKLKIDDAFVTKYVDGSRIPYDHIMEGPDTVYIHR